MKGLNAAVLLLALVISGTAAQYCGDCKPCYERCLNYLDRCGGYFEKYADYLRFIKGTREIGNHRGTAYAMDMTGRKVEWKMQKNVAYATAIINPADTECNPFFIDKYSQKYYVPYCVIAQASQQCKSRCEAGDIILNHLGGRVRERDEEDRLDCGCKLDRILAQVPGNGIPCEPLSLSREEMFLAIYNSNDQRVNATEDCGTFPTRIATKINGPGNIPGFINKNLKWHHRFPAHAMKHCLKRFCCKENARERRSSKRNWAVESGYIVSFDGDDAKTINAKSEEELNEKLGGARRPAPPTREEIAENAKIAAEIKEAQQGQAETALRVAREEAKNLEGWTPPPIELTDF